MKDKEVSYENLKFQIENLCRENFVYLVILNNYLSEMPRPIKQTINNIIEYNIVPYETLKNVCDKYKLKECEKMLNDIKNAPKHSDKYFEETNEALISLCEKLNECFNT